MTDRPPVRPKTVGADAVVEGLNVFATNPESMNLNITEGLWRFEGIEYSNVVGDYTMHEDSLVAMSESSDFTMSETSHVDTVTIAAAPAEGYWRYDALVIGIDGVIDVITGVAFSVADGQAVDDVSFLYPTTPDYHIRIAIDSGDGRDHGNPAIRYQWVMVFTYPLCI